MTEQRLADIERAARGLCTEGMPPQSAEDAWEDVITPQTVLELTSEIRRQRARRSIGAVLRLHWWTLAMLVANGFFFVLSLRPGGPIDQAGWPLVLMYVAAFIALGACIVLDEAIYRRDQRRARIIGKGEDFSAIRRVFDEVNRKPR